MRTLKTSEAAAMLNVSANTLRAWERRFDYPQPQRTAGKHRVYVHGEVAALRDALRDGLSISSAVSRARESLRSDTHILVGALASFELERADGAMEAALAMRSVERTVEEVLLPSVAELARRSGTDSAAWAMGCRWALEWLRRAQRMTPPPARPGALLIGDATDGRPRPRRARGPRARAVRGAHRRPRRIAAGRQPRRRRRPAVRAAARRGHHRRPPAPRRRPSRASPTPSARRAARCRWRSSAAARRGGERISAVPSLPPSPSEATAQALALLDGHAAAHRPPEVGS